MSSENAGIEVQMADEELSPVKAAPGLFQSEIENAVDGVAIARWESLCKQLERFAPAVARRFDPSERSPKEFTNRLDYVATVVESSYAQMRAVVQFYRERARVDIAACEGGDA